MRRAFLVALLATAACPSNVEQRRDKVSDLRSVNPTPSFPAAARMLEPEGGGVVGYLGLDVDPPDPRTDQALTVTHYWRVEHAPRTDAEVITEIRLGGRTVVEQAHRPLYGRLDTSAWRPGDVWADRRVIRLPDSTPGGTLELLIGLRSDRMAWTLEANAGAQDGQDRLRAARIAVRGPAPPEVSDLPQVLIPRARETITADGRLDEPAWADAEVLSFSDSLGRNQPIRYATRLRLLYDDRFLYVGFEADDADITERYQKRDDPIYEHETVELFIMPNVAAPATGPYVELQASPGGVIFDASFDGPRQGMNKRYGAGQTVGTTIDGTLNDPAVDRRWVSEWRVPFDRIRGVRAPPKPGDEWRMNAFRIEKHEHPRRGAEFSAWSPPRVGDFHHVARFGRMRFGGAKP